jgi:hypothetical protein
MYKAQTDRTIPNNKPDIIIRDNDNGAFILIDIPYPGDTNVIRNKAEKIINIKIM